MNYPLTYQQFVDHFKRGKLLGLKCNSCQAITTPPRISCGQCGSSTLDLMELCGKGQIESYTVIRAAPEPFHPPYIVCIAKLLEGPRLMGNLIKVSPEEIDLNFITRNVRVGYKVSPGDNLSGGERFSITFELC